MPTRPKNRARTSSTASEDPKNIFSKAWFKQRKQNKNKRKLLQYTTRLTELQKIKNPNDWQKNQIAHSKDQIKKYSDKNLKKTPNTSAAIRGEQKNNESKTVVKNNNKEVKNKKVVNNNKVNQNNEVKNKEVKNKEVKKTNGGPNLEAANKILSGNRTEVTYKDFQNDGDNKKESTPKKKKESKWIRTSKGTLARRGSISARHAERKEAARKKIQRLAKERIEAKKNKLKVGG